MSNSSQENSMKECKIRYIDVKNYGPASRSFI